MSTTSRRHTERWRTGPPLIAGLVVLWLLLWQSIAPLTIVTGVVTALLVVRVLELPPVPHIGRFRPLSAIALTVWFLGQLVVASVQVAALAFRAALPGGKPRSGLVAVQLRARDDLLLTLTGVVLTLIPGTLIVEVDRAEAVLYLHVLDASSDDRVEAARRQALETERRLVRAIGSPGEIEVAG